MAAEIASPDRGIDQTQSHEVRDGCIFCRLIDHKEKSVEITRTDRAVSIVSLEGHPLVLPIRHVTKQDVENGEGLEDMAAVNDLALRLISPIEEAYGASGVNVVTNVGKSAGQEIQHMHTHLITRRDNDSGMRVTVPFRPKQRSIPGIVQAIQSGLEAQRV